ncbi:hypothetical protein B4N89_03210 [Embleya scabrispora]|uniref:Uncharacterized protein n=1 Tax=Embleya scabrispora TaxID=159449 RepID=A0A1T3NTC8_9ACTN|nr:hypothetical protein [Embleya scabrispora]OPC80089.1 hypothetical protein B4N89_03210 [Embleya scabrispora]
MIDEHVCVRAVASGIAASSGPERTAIFDAVRAERDGPTVRLLWRLAEAGPADNRLRAIELLRDSAPFGETWPSVAAYARSWLTDAESGVRVAAARLFVATAEVETVAAWLPEAADPDVRVAGTIALLGRGREFDDAAMVLTEDADPAVRVTAALVLLGDGDLPWAWRRAMCEAIRADLGHAVRRLRRDGGPMDVRVGSEWAWRLLGDEEECHEIARSLLTAEDRDVRWVGVDMAAAAIRLWRTGPTELLPALAGVAEEADAADDALRAESLRVLRLSRDVWRAAAGRWARRDDAAARRLSAELGEPRGLLPPPDLEAVFAAQRLPDGRAEADGWLAEQPVEPGSSERRVARTLMGLVAHGGLTERQVRQAMCLFERERVRKYEVAGVLWRHLGPGDAEFTARLVAEMSAVAGDQYVGELALQVLADMGGHAAGALPCLSALIDDHARLTAHVGSAEAEIAFDETRRAQLVGVRDRIATAIP